MKRFPKWWPFLLTSAIYLLLQGVYIFKSIQANDGNFVYALDDAYIHMAMAQNIADHGIMGVTPHAFTAASSSLFWTFLLSFLYKAHFAREYLPLILNIMFALGLFFVINRFSKLPSLIRFFLLFMIVAATPVLSLTMMGMEHLAQIFWFTLFLFLVAERVLAKTNALFWSLFFVGIMVGSVRYEGLFLIFAACLIFFIQKQWIDFFSLMLAGSLPIFAFGLFSLYHEGFFLPNSVYIKGVSNAYFHIYALSKMIFNNELFFFVILGALTALVSAFYGKQECRSQIFLLIFLITGIFFLIFVPYIKSQMRYSSPLVVLGLVAFFTWLNQWMILDSRRLFRMVFIVLMICAILYPLWPRIVRAHSTVVTATKNIYQQQYQMANFLRQYYNESVIVANDIGAISYYTSIRLFDVYGLASSSVAKLKKNNRYRREMIEEMAHDRGVKIAIVYDSWMQCAGGVPRTWQLKGRWSIRHNVACGDAMVSFYAVDSTEANKLVENLKEFSKQLPDSIYQVYNESYVELRR